MQCNLNGGRIYKGSIAQIDVFLYPACYTGVTDVVANFYTVSGQSIQKTDMVIEDGIATVLFQAVEIETFEDGLLKYNVSYVKDGDTYTKDYETRWFIKTPIPYTPIDYVTTANVTDVVENLITGNTGVSTEIQAQIDASVSGKADTSAVTQSLNTKQDRLTAGSNISIVNNVISATGIPTSNSALTNDAGYATGSYVDTKVLSSVSGKADTTAVTQALATKQDTLVAGPNIRLVGNVISVTGMPSMTSQLVNDSDFITSSAIPTSNTALTNDAGYITSSAIPTSNSAFTNDEGYATSGYVDTTVESSVSGKQDTLVSGTNIKTINNQSILGSGNIMITSATPTNYTAGTNISIDNGIISVTGITVPTSNTALTNDAHYVNSAQTQTQINNSIVNKADTSAVTEAISGKQDKLTAGPNIKIATNIISVTGIPSMTSQLVNDSDYVNSTQVQTQIGNSISGKQDTLVSGTNIKTVNNQSLLGSGNIVITSATPTQYSAGTNISIVDNVISVTGITVPTSNTALTNDAHYVNSGEVQTQINDSISGLSPYTAGTNIDINNNIISVTGITSYTGVTSQEIITALGYTPAKVTGLTQTQYNNLQTKDNNTIYAITGN